MASMPRFSVNEFITKKDRYITKKVLLMGIVKEGSIVLKGDTASFILSKNNQELSVYYDGQDGIPDTFKEGIQALLEGKINNKGQLFLANKITTKCASKYNKDHLNDS